LITVLPFPACNSGNTATDLWFFFAGTFVIDRDPGGSGFASVAVGFPVATADRSEFPGTSFRMFFSDAFGVGNVAVADAEVAVFAGTTHQPLDGSAGFGLAGGCFWRRL